jgi:APA family basic amino acid/polyamine antiporter
MRKTDPNTERPFKTPLVPLVPILGVLICTGMIIALDAQTLKVAIIWMVIGLAVYFLYSRKNSKLNLPGHKPGEILPKASDFEER